MHDNGRYALATIAGAIMLAAATIIVGFHAGTALERVGQSGVEHSSRSSTATDNRSQIPDPHLADRS
jgi:hypothetical protein